MKIRQFQAIRTDEEYQDMEDMMVQEVNDGKPDYIKGSNDNHKCLSQFMIKTLQRLIDNRSHPDYVHVNSLKALIQELKGEE